MTDRRKPSPYDRPGWTPPKVPGMGPTGPRRGLDLTSPGSGTLKPSVDTGHHRLAADQTIAIGIATTVRRANGGGGARPFTGHNAEGALPEITPADYLSEARAARRESGEYRLIEAATALVHGGLIGPVRKRVQDECREKIAVLEAHPGSGQTVAQAVKRALGF